MSLTNIIQYAKDIKYAVGNFETGFGRKDVVEGYFVDNELGQNQKAMYNGMLDIGFTRTSWQLVFPGQTAGIIRKIESPLEGIDEMHVRFYDDGIISAELEYGRFSLGHWRKSRKDGNHDLIQIIDNEIENISDEQKKQIKSQIIQRDYIVVDSKQFQMPDFSNFVASAFIAIQYSLTTAGAIYLVSKGEFYYALEPGFLSLVETPLILGALLPKIKDPTGTAPLN